MTRTRRAAIVGFVGVFLLLFAGGSSATSASTMARAKTSWMTGVKAVLPANAAPASVQNVSIASVSCPSPGNCSAVGTYLDDSQNFQGLLLSETAGRWATGVEAALPANTGFGVSLYEISCPSAGNCGAVGGYFDGSGGAHGLLLTETAGVWSKGVEPVLPANASTLNQSVDLRSISCVSAGNCSAVGTYDDSLGSDGVLLTETAGNWSTGVEATLPSNADSAQDLAGLEDVSCASAGNCTAMGTYVDNADDIQGLLLTDTAGALATGIEAPVPDDAATSQSPDELTQVRLISISCTSAGNCGAVGTYTIGFDRIGNPELAGLLLTETAGTWAATSNTSPLYSVSCPSAGNCTAVGAGDQVQTEKAGTWESGVEVALPANAAKKKGVVLKSVSCVSAGNCAAVGTYSDSSGVGQGLILTKSSGHWATGVKAVLPSGAVHGGGLDSVSCASTGKCSAVGSYLNGSSSPQGGLLFNGSTTPPPCVVPRLRAQTLPAAKRSIKSHGCSVGKVKHATSRRIKRDHVISQKPKAGRQLKHGANVSLVVSKGP